MRLCRLSPAGVLPLRPSRPNPGAVPSDLLAHGGVAPYGGEALFWVAQVVPNKEPASPGSMTRFFAVRASESKWQQWGEGVPARAVSLASRGSQLAVLLDDGSWMLLSDDNSPTTGSRLAVPNAALVSFADDGRNLWALAKIPGGLARLRTSPPPPVTSPATMASTGPFDKLTAGPATSHSSTHPTTVAVARPSGFPATEPAGPSIGPGPEMVFGLLSLAPDGWVGEAGIPQEIARPGDEVSLALIEGEPYLAVRGAAGPVRIFRLLDANRGPAAATTASANPWALICTIELPGDAQDFQLLNGTPVPTLWARGRAGPDLLYLCKLNAAGSATPSPTPVLLESTRGAAPSLRAAAYALGLVRSIFVRDGELYQQSYDRLSGCRPTSRRRCPCPRPRPSR